MLVYRGNPFQRLARKDFQLCIFPCEEGEYEDLMEWGVDESLDEKLFEQYIEKKVERG